MFYSEVIKTVRNKHKYTEACLEGVCFSVSDLMLIRLGVKKMEEQFENEEEENRNNFTNVTLPGQMTKKANDVHIKILQLINKLKEEESTNNK